MGFFKKVLSALRSALSSGSFDLLHFPASLCLYLVLTPTILRGKGGMTLESLSDPVQSFLCVSEELYVRQQREITANCGLCERV